MTRRKAPPAPKAVREPIQVYLEHADRQVLDDVAGQLGLSRAEVLRRGLRAYARQQGGAGPVLKLVRESAAAQWPATASETQPDHDTRLAEIYLDRHEDAS